MAGPMTSGDQRGFTLVELLLVVAIVAMLAALGLPEISAADRAWRERARQREQAVLDRAAAQLAWEKGAVDTSPQALAVSGYAQRGLMTAAETREHEAEP